MWSLSQRMDPVMEVSYALKLFYFQLSTCYPKVTIVHCHGVYIHATIILWPNPLGVQCPLDHIVISIFHNYI